jgi:hypothetical protein
MACCHFKSNCNRISISLHLSTSRVPESAIMGRAPIYNGINRAGLSSKARVSPHPGPAVIRAGNHLAVACLFFGAAFAAFVSGSLEQRIGNLFCFGLIPAVGFYVGGHILGQLLMFGVQLCDMIMARCFRYVVRLINDLLNWAGTYVSNWVDRAPAPSEASAAPFSQPSSKFTFLATGEMNLLK